MLKTFKYRLYPTKREERLLSEQLEELRWLWNTLLAERKIAWEERQEAVSYYDQQNALPTMKTSLRPPLAQVHSLVVQDAVRRLQKAMDAFFRRLKAGENPGYPRFRGKGRYDSLTYPQWDNGVKLSASGKRLILSKIGDVKLISHRPLEGTQMTATSELSSTRGSVLASSPPSLRSTAMSASSTLVTGLRPRLTASTLDLSTSRPMHANPARANSTAIGRPA